MKNIRSNFVKESFLDYENLANTLKENTSNAVKDLLNEAVRETYNKLLTEGDEDEYDEETVEDTTSDTKSEDDAKKSSKKATDEDSEMEDDPQMMGDETVAPEEGGAEMGGEEPTPEEGAAAEGGTEDEWAEFDKYKVDGTEDEYDFSQADDDEIVKVYKLLKDDDQVLVNVDNNAQKIELKDNSTGAEYLLDLSSFGGDAEPMDDMSAEGDLETENDDIMESRIFEIALNEYDSHVGYTDNYQKKDVMTNPGTSEPGKNVNDWDAGVPHGDSKPWSGRNGKKDDKPFTAQKGKTVESEEMDEEPVNELKTVQEHPANVGSTSRTDGPNNPRARKARNFHTAQNGQETSTSDNPYKGSTNESRMLNKVNKILKENNELKKALVQFKTVLEEAAVTNLNLGQIIKLISENSTTKDEKKEIIARFGKEAKTVNESKKLYASINNELKKKNVMNITEDKQFTTNGSKMINETQIYQSKDLLDSLDMMHKICK